MNVKFTAKKSFKGKTFMKNVHFDFPTLNAFEEKPELEFILTCVQMISSRYKNRYVRNNEQGDIVGIEYSDDKIEPFIESWGIELKTINNDVATSLFYKRIVSEKDKDCDELLINLVISAFKAIRENIDACINALEEEEVKQEVINEKDFFINFLDRAIKEFNELNSKGE